MVRDKIEKTINQEKYIKHKKRAIIRRRTRLDIKTNGIKYPRTKLKKAKL
jgi:hypothetical protein